MLWLFFYNRQKKPPEEDREVLILKLTLNCTEGYAANDELGEAEVNDHYR